jgi:hypothetical protein
MCIVLGLDTFNSVLTIVSHHFAFSNIPRIILAVLFFFSEAYLLHLIGRMCGERVVFHRTFTRWHFDLFLLGLVLWSLMLVGWFFGGLNHVTVNIWWGMEILEFLALWGVGWVASWGPLEMTPETMIV